MVTKNLQVVTKANDVDEKGRVTVAVNRTGIEDSQGDISMSGSFDKTLKNDLQRMKWLYNHDHTQLLGVPLEGKEKDGDIIMVGQLNMNKQLCKDVYTDYKLMAEHGRTLEHSVGVIPIKRDKQDKRKVHEWMMLEYSTLAFLGANPCTFMVDIKSATADKVKQAVEFLQAALKEPAYSDVKLKNIDMELSLLLKKLNGGNIVQCPHCGKNFDMDNVRPYTMEQYVLDTTMEYVRWAVDDAVYDHIQDVKPEIVSEVSNVLTALKANNLALTEKSVTALLNFVYCPHCWSRVYTALLGGAEEETTEDPAQTDDTTKEKTFGSMLSGIAAKMR